MTREIIKIRNVRNHGRTLVAQFEVTDGLKRYFNDEVFFCEYDFSLEGIDPGILAVPVLNSIIQIAWMAGADVRMDVIEVAHLRSCELLRDAFARFYPEAPFNTHILAERLETGVISGNNTLQLFSGGVDSVTSYISNKNRKPILVIIDYEPAGIHREVIEFAQKLPQGAHTVRTNCYSFLNRRNLDADFGHLTEGTWWGGIQHGMALLGLTAPITQWRNASSVVIAATHDASFDRPWGSDPKIDNLVKWATVVCYHDGYALTRQQKIDGLVRSYATQAKAPPLLMVCNSYARVKDRYNCSRCAKCAQAIIGLLIANGDPRRYGFEIADTTFSWIKECLDTATFFARNSDYWTWEDCHRTLRTRTPALEHSIEGASEFLQWFKELDLSYENNFNHFSVMRDRPGYTLKRFKDTYTLETP